MNEEKLSRLRELVELFDSNIETYKGKNYDEANTRTDFIDKFFELLDWDVSNAQGYAEQYRDVVREDKVIIEKKPKAPDYSFRIGGTRKFFVEAKKPAVNIKDDFAPAFQVRRYGYTAKLPLSILTDFEEFAVYDTRIKPSKTDKPSTARIFYGNFKDYEKNWDFIYNTFSKNAILKGSFDKYVQQNKNKKGSSEIDKEFLKLIEGWRNELAKNIAIRNKDLSIHELNHAVQTIIDRIIFLRIAEDRNMETYGMLSKIADKTEIFTFLDQWFVKADKKYNSGLFDIKKYISDLSIDDKVLKPILKGLYYPDCPYEFSVLGVEILGQIYEQFLGKTIRLTAGHQAKIEEKPEVRKAGGVYYTPQYIVEYIVKNTVGTWISEAGVRLSEIRKLLFNIYKYQDDKSKQDRHLQRLRSLAKEHGISEDDLSDNRTIPAEGNVQFDQPNSKVSSVDSEQHCRGTRQRLQKGNESICTNSEGLIVGTRDTNVDSKRHSLCGRNEIWENLGKNARDRAFIERIYTLFTKEQLDPKTDLQKPITPKICDPACGSGSFLLGAYEFLLDWHLAYYMDEKNRKKALKESKIYQTSETDFHLSIEEKKRILINNIYGVDIDAQAVEVTKLSLLLKLMEGENEESTGQLFKYSDLKILPDLSGNIKCGNSLIGSDFYDQQDLSLFDEEQMRRVNVFDWEEQFSEIFENGGFDCVIGNPPYVLVQGDNRNDENISFFRKVYSVASYKLDLYHLFLEKGILILKKEGLLSFITPSNFLTNNGLVNLRKFFLEKTKIKEFNLIQGQVFSASVDTIVSIFENNENKKNEVKFIFSIWENNQLSIEKIYNIQQNKFLNNKEFLFTVGEKSELKIGNYQLGENYFVKFGMQLRNRKIFVSDVIKSEQKELILNDHKPCYTGKDVKRYFIDYSELLAFVNEEARCGGCWNLSIHETRPKILVRQIGESPICSLDENGFYCLNTMFMIVPKTKEGDDLKYILGVLNSKFIKNYWKNNFYDMRKTFPKIKGSYLEQLPIPKVTHEQQKPLIDLVDQMLETQKKLHTAKLDSDRKMYEQKAKILDKKIDDLVFDLYGLSEEERKICLEQ